MDSIDPIVKVCTNCRFCVIRCTEDDDDEPVFLCYAPPNIETDPVTGKTVLKVSTCRQQRSGKYERCCDPSGRWFEKKRGADTSLMALVLGACTITCIVIVALITGR